LKFSGVPGTNLISPDENEAFSGTSAPSAVAHFVANTQALFTTDTLQFGKHWQINGAARVDRFDADYRNQVPSPSSLQHTDTVPSWLSAYDLTAKLTVGGSVDYSSSRVPGTVVDGNGFRQEVPGYWSTSALVRYRIATRVNAQLNVNNIANRRFYDGLDDNHVNVSAGRSAVLSVIVEK
jgi:catecholate siderophore receptor